MRPNYARVLPFVDALVEERLIVFKMRRQFFSMIVWDSLNGRHQRVSHNRCALPCGPRHSLPQLTPCRHQNVTKHHQNLTKLIRTTTFLPDDFPSWRAIMLHWKCWLLALQSQCILRLPEPVRFFSDYLWLGNVRFSSVPSVTFEWIYPRDPANYHQLRSRDFELLSAL